MTASSCAKTGLSLTIKSSLTSSNIQNSSNRVLLDLTTNKLQTSFAREVVTFTTTTIQHPFSYIVALQGLNNN